MKNFKMIPSYILVIICILSACRQWTPILLVTASETRSHQTAGPPQQTTITTTNDDIKPKQEHCEKLTRLSLTRPATSANNDSNQFYYYTRTRDHPSHLRMAEELKNNFVDEVRHEAKINGSDYKYYKAPLSSAMNYDELLYETIDKMFRHRLSAFYIHHYDRDEDRRRSSDPRLVSQEACARDLLYLIEKMPKRSLYRASAEMPSDDPDEPLTPELAAYFDSFGRQEAGLFRGNIYWTGSHDQCVNRHIFDLIDASQQQPEEPGSNELHQRRPKQQVVSFRGRYCVAALKAPVWENLIANKRREARQYFKTRRQMDEYAKLFRLQLGLCLPDSCDSNSLERHLDEIRLLAKSSLEARFDNYELVDLYCLPDESSPLRQWSGSALVFLGLVFTWLILVLAATLSDLMDLFHAQETGDKPQRKLVQFVRLMSLRANYQKLMHVSSSGQENDASEQKKTPSDGSGPQAETTTANERSQAIQVDLRFLNALKALIMFWIINGHIMLLMIQTAKNILDSDALLNGLMHFLIGATFGVDLFFTMTGFLTAYLLFDSSHAYRMKFGTWIYLSFHRYWRLAPMYLLAFWFSRSVAQLLGSGPLWDYGTSGLTFRGLCAEESWLFPLTLTSNLHGLFEECMITSWYISCDMQFWLVSPIFIYLLARSPLQGWLVTIATILASAKMRFDAVLSDKSARYDELVQPRADIFMRVSHDLPALYTHPHYRISAYLVGLLAGHYVYMIKTSKWSSVLLNRAHSSGTFTTTTNGDESQREEKTIETTTMTTTKRVNNDNEDKRTQAALTRTTRVRQLLAYTGLVLFLVMASSSYLLANFFPSSLLRHSKPIAATLHSLDHLLMSSGASLLIVTMCLGQWRRLRLFLSHPNWSRLAKINYALLLLQCEAIYYQIFRYDQVPVAGTRELINILFNLLVTLYPLAFVATLVFEFPLANLEKFALSALAGGGKKTKQAADKERPRETETSRPAERNKRLDEEREQVVKADAGA